MKVRVTLLTENDKHVNATHEELLQATRTGWDFICRWLTMMDDESDKATVESVEIIEN